MYSTILDSIKDNKIKFVKEQLIEMQVQDIADLLEQIEKPTDLVKVFKILPKSMGAEVFSYIDSDIQEKLIFMLS